MSKIDGEFGFDAEFAARHLDMSWVQEMGWLGEGRTFAAVEFTADAESTRCWATVKIDIEDEQGYIERVNYEWPDTDAVCLEALRELRKAQALEALTAPLKAAREAQGLSQREVGELMGLAPSAAQGAIARWENGQREPSASNLAAWADALGMALEIVPKK